MTDTPLDLAYRAMDTAPQDDAARLRFHERLADAELFLLLTEEPQGDNISPEVFDLPDLTCVLAFDTEDRLAQFTGTPAPYAALPGRVIVSLLAAQGMGLGLNLEVAPSSTIVPAEAVAWLADMLSESPTDAEARPVEFARPHAPEALVTALDAKLSTATGLARNAYLAAVTYEDGVRSHVLGLTGTRPGAEDAIARAVNEALIFSGIEAGALDVMFLKDSDSAAAQLARVGLRFDLPQPDTAPTQTPRAPGSDPDHPPRLR